MSIRTRHTPRRPRNLVRRRFAAGTVPPQGAAPQSLRLPITNVYGGGDYTAAILIGSRNTPANVIIDTGSSTLAVQATLYNPAQDTALQPTSLAQVVLYGTGGWAGPVLHTPVSLGGAALPSAPIALAVVQEPNNFGAADGILGLAYNALNDAWNLAAELTKKGVNPPYTYLWPLHIKGTQTALEAFEQSLGNGTPIDPYFTALESQGIVANKLAFYTRRSFPHYATANSTPAALAQDKLNQGYLIVGGGEEQTDLYTGAFQAVTVVDDLYYNVNLKTVQVGTAAPVAVAALQAQYLSDAGSNAIVDSGTNSLDLAPDVFASIVRALESLNPKFVQQLKTASKNEHVATAALDLPAWPNITFTLQGPNGDVSLTVTPSNYWQVDFPAPGQAFAVVGGQPSGGPNQSILGLPLMNGYYSVFDRSTDANGVIQFATINPGA